MALESKSRSEVKRAAIIDAAKSAFKEYGVRATSMDKLAELAQVSKRTVYNHFDSKETLVMHLISELWQQATSQAEVMYKPEIDITVQLKEIIKAEVDLINTQEYLDLSRVAIGHLFYSPNELQKEVEKISCQETTIQRWITAATNDNKLNISDIDLASKQLQDLIKGSCFWPQLFNIEPLLSEKEKQYIIDETVTMFMLRYQIK